jgi:hypothetical protein
MFVFFHGDVVIDRALLRQHLPAATGQALAMAMGGEVVRWQAAYQRVQADWDSYWADLSLDDDDSLGQWREGRFRIVRGVFRVAGQQPPAAEQMTQYMDDLPRSVGRRCPAIRVEDAALFRQLADQKIGVGIVTPTQASGLVWGMLEAAGLDSLVSAVLGPDELGQVGLEGISGTWMAWQSGDNPSDVYFVGPFDFPDVCILASGKSLTQLINRER